MRRAAALAILPPLVGLVLVTGCSDVPTDETPRGTVRLFLSAMARTEEDPRALQEAYRLLARPSRRALVQRARLAESLGANRIEPWDMLVRGRSRPTFTPAPGSRGMREHIDGDTATVTVTNEEGSRRAEVPLVRENGRWRVVLDIPAVRGGD